MTAAANRWGRPEDCDERAPYGIAERLEHCGDRSIKAYDETTPSSILHPNGTMSCSGHRGFVGAALRIICDLHHAHDARDRTGK